MEICCLVEGTYHTIDLMSRKMAEEKIDSDEDDSEEAVLRKRDWDSFKDDNPRGLGNRYNQG